MFMWLKLGAGVKDADDIIDTLREEKVGVVPGEYLQSFVREYVQGCLTCQRNKSNRHPAGQLQPILFYISGLMGGA